MSTAAEYAERFRIHLGGVPEAEREAARGDVVHALSFLASELGDWRRKQKATGHPEVPELDVRHAIALDTVMRAFGAAAMPAREG